MILRRIERPPLHLCRKTELSRSASRQARLQQLTAYREATANREYLAARPATIIPILGKAAATSVTPAATKHSKPQHHSHSVSDQRSQGLVEQLLRSAALQLCSTPPHHCKSTLIYNWHLNSIQTLRFKKKTQDIKASKL